MKYLSTTNQQTGFSLIELMVALAIGLFIMLGAIQVFISNQASYRLIDGLARTQENGRFALELISRDIRMAGFPTDSFSGTRRIIGTNGASDSVTIEYESETATIDCAGNNIAAGAILKHTYSINGNNLICTGSTAGVSEVIVEGIENMQLIYGEDTDAPTDGFPNRYVDATQIGVKPDGSAQPATDTNARWDRITTVRLNLLVNSVNPAVEESQSYFFNGANVNPTDLLFRQEYTTTITLRGQTL